MKEDTKGKLRRIRDFFWPVLEAKDSDKKDLSISLEKCSFLSDKNIDLAIQAARDFSAREEDRRKTVENKASILIGTFSVVITILLNFLKDIILGLNTYPIFFTATAFIFASIIVVYLSFSVYHATNVLTKAKEGYDWPAVPSFLYNGTREYKTLLFLKIRNSTYANMSIINKKVDSMTMAYEFFKCAIRTVIIFAIILAVLFILS